MELELKHLAPYLPYGLELRLEYFSKKYSEQVTENITLNVDNIHIFYDDKNIKPILRPLSKLTNDELIPIGLIIRDIEKHKATYKDNIFAIEDAKAWIRTGMKPVLSLKQVCEVMEHLYSIHADIFGLIDAGLAIEMEESHGR